MTRLVCTGDLQLGGGQSLTPQRLHDQEHVLTHIAELCATEGAAALLIAGDLADSRHPSEETRAVFRRFCERVEETCPVVAIVGNHDVAATSEVPWAVNFHDLIGQVYDRPAVWRSDSVHVACLPYVPAHRLIAAHGGRDGVEETYAELLLQVARGLRDEIPAGAAAVLLLHGMVSGANLPNGLPVEALGTVLSLAGLDELGWDAIVCGDIHAPQTLSTVLTPAAFYTGSPYVCDWGEAHYAHGCFVLDVDAGRAEARFVPLADRPFLTSDLTADALADLDVLSVAVDEGAVVRIRFQATAEQARRVDQQAIRQAFLNGGAHRVTVQPEIVRAARARVDGMHERLDELAALDMWVAAEGIDGEAAAAIRAYTRDSLQAVTA